MSVIGRVLIRITPRVSLNALTRPSIRNSSFKSSPFLADLGPPSVKYTVTQDPKEWEYVEQALPPKVIPKPSAREIYHSDWKPPADHKESPYCIERTKNHMIPVYLHVSPLGVRRITHVRRVRGDIWRFHNDIIAHLQPAHRKPLRSQVNELTGNVLIYGDHVTIIKNWLIERNF